MSDRSTPVRAVLAAPFPEVVRLHQLLAEYADQVEIAAVVHAASDVGAQLLAERPAVLVLSAQLGLDLAFLLDQLTQASLAVRIVLLSGDDATAEEGARVGQALADVVLDADSGAEALRNAILADHEEVDAWPPQWLRMGANDAPEPAAAVQQEIVIAPEPPAAPARGRVVVVLSGKGGVGVSVVATNLAVVLAQRGASVAVLDLDLQYGDVGVLLRVESHPGSIESAAQRGARLEDLMATGPEGVRALLAPARAAAAPLITAQVVGDVLDEMVRGHEHVIVDTAPGLDDRLRAAIERADRLLVVSAFSLAAVKDAKITLKLLEELGVDLGRIGVVLNQTRRRATLGRADIEASLHFPILLQLPFEAGLDASVDSGVPLVVSDPRSEFARQIGVLADQLGDQSPAAAPAEGPRRRFSLRR